MAKFKLINAQHIIRNPAWDPTKEKGEGNPKSLVLEPGAIVEGVDLDRKHPNKFIRVDDSSPVVSLTPRKSPEPTTGGAGRDLDKEYGPLDRMSADDLKEVAAGEEIDISECRTKAEILKKLRGG